MNIQAEKIELLKMLLETENPRILESIKNIFKKESDTDFWNDLCPHQQQEIERASTEVKNGNVSDYESFMQRHR